MRILPHQAAVFVSFFGKKKAFKVCFWRKSRQTEIICPMSLLTVCIDNIPVLTREAVTAEDGVVTVQVF